jgi:hypothetical protein
MLFDWLVTGHLNWTRLPYPSKPLPIKAFIPEQ